MSVRRKLSVFAVLCASIVGGLALFFMNEARVQNAAVGDLERVGADVVFEPTVPSWLANTLPRDFFHRVVEVRLEDSSVKAIPSLAKLRSVRKLWLVNTGIYDVTPLSRLWELEELVIDSSPVRDLSPLSNLSKLSVLRFNETKVRDLAPLAELNLQELWFSKTAIHRLDPLADMTSLRRLALMHTTVSDLAPLQALIDMEAIQLDHSHVKDLRPLEKMANLSEVGYRGLPIYPSQLARLDVFLPNWECQAFADGVFE